ncbi:hypothetical protein MMC11_002371 [Xylographa trunciseda]|nr:hypothetical protein [Xylographa trunciseda]
MPRNIRRRWDIVPNDDFIPLQPNRPPRRRRGPQAEDEHEPAQPNRPHRRNTQASELEDDENSDTATVRPPRPSRTASVRPEPIDSEDDEQDTTTTSQASLTPEGTSRRSATSASGSATTTNIFSTQPDDAFSSAPANTSAHTPSIEGNQTQLALALEESRRHPVPNAVPRFDESQLEQAERESREAHETAERERERRETEIEERILRESAELEERKEREREEARRRNQRLLAEYGGDIEGGSGAGARGGGELDSGAASVAPARSSEHVGGRVSTATDAPSAGVRSVERAISQRSARPSRPLLSSSPSPSYASRVSASSSTTPRPTASSPLASPSTATFPIQAPPTPRPDPQRTRTGSIRHTLDTARRASASSHSPRPAAAASPRPPRPSSPTPTTPASPTTPQLPATPPSRPRTPEPPARSELPRTPSARAAPAPIHRARTLNPPPPPYSPRASTPTHTTTATVSSSSSSSARPSTLSHLRRSDSAPAYSIPPAHLSATVLASRRQHALHTLQTAPEDSAAYARALGLLDVDAGGAPPARALQEEGLEDDARPPSYEHIGGDRTVNPWKWTTSSREEEVSGGLRRLWRMGGRGEWGGGENGGWGRGGRMERRRREESERVNRPFTGRGRERGW